MRFTFLVLAAAGLSAATLRAQSYVFRFEGTITSTTGTSPSVQVGQGFHYRYRFNTQTPDANPDPAVGQYTGAINHDALFTCSPMFLSVVPGNIVVHNNGPLGDVYAAWFNNALYTAEIRFRDTSATAFSSDSLPSTLNPAQFSEKRLILNGPTWSASGVVTSFVGVEYRCYVDCNFDGAINLSDFHCFQTQFSIGNIYADCNGDNILNLADFGCWQTVHAIGCP